MKKIILSSLIFSLFFSFPAEIYANKSQNQNQSKPHQKDHKEILENQYQQLSQDERIRKIENLYNEHLQLDYSNQDQIRSNEIRNEIIWLLPNNLEEDVVKAAYEKNNIFESVVQNTLYKMKGDTTYKYNVKEKKLFGVQVAFVTDVSANNVGLGQSSRPPAQQNPNDKLTNQYQNLSNDERIKKIEALYNEHTKYDNGTAHKARVSEIRNEIVRLLPNSLEPDVVANLYERNGLFERAVKKALDKMKDDTNLKYDSQEKSIFGGMIKVKTVSE